jgi:dimethylamine/trimethylamine dehydrogenase
MVGNVRVFSDYQAALVVSYEEEISGEAFFARLAEFYSGRQCRALLLLAEIERYTASAIRPLMDRHRLVAAEPAELRAIGREEAETHIGDTWQTLVAGMASKFPDFVEEFEQIERLAPAGDKARIGILKEHELAAIEFARKEAKGAPNSLVPLEAFLASHADALTKNA